MSLIQIVGLSPIIVLIFWTLTGLFINKDEYLFRYIISVVPLCYIERLLRYYNIGTAWNDDWGLTSIQLVFVVLNIIIYLLSRRKKKQHWVETLLFLLVITNIVLLPFSLNFNRSLPFLLIGIIDPILIFSLIINLIDRDPKKIDKIWEAFLISHMMWYLLPLLEGVELFFIRNSIDILQYRYMGAIGGNTLLVNKILVFPLCVAGLFYSDFFSKKSIIYMKLIVVVNLVYLLITFSRAYMIFFGISTIIALFVIKKNKSGFTPTKAIIFLVILVIFSWVTPFILSSYFPIYSMALEERFFERGVETSQTFIEKLINDPRIELQKDNLIMMKNYGFWGVGRGNYQTTLRELTGNPFAYTEAHNLFINEFLQSGILGGLLTMFIVFSLPIIVRKVKLKIFRFDLKFPQPVLYLILIGFWFFIFESLTAGNNFTFYNDINKSSSGYVSQAPLFSFLVLLSILVSYDRVNLIEENKGISFDK